MASGAATGSRSADAVEEILERSAEFYENALWESETGESVRGRLAEAEIDSKTLRAFNVGYAPVQPRELTEHLAQWKHSAGELVEAGVVTRSGRKHLHARFHSRIMFPIRDRRRNLLGFTGLATHLGPSWPLWLSSPEREWFRRGEVLFGIDRAAPAIRKARRAIVLNDCLEVVRLHAAGERNAVAVVQSPITEEHLELLGAELSLARQDVATVRLSGASRGSMSVTLVGAANELEDEQAEPGQRQTMPVPAKPAELIVAAGEGADNGRDLPEVSQRPTRWQRSARAAGATLIGLGLPLLWLAIVRPDNAASAERGRGVVLVALGVGASYGVLALVAARVSARARARSIERRMRAPYLIGATEWQPPAWTYHRIEDLVVAAAVVSMLILVVMFMTIGGYTGWNTT